MGLFERYLSVWVALAIVAGTVLGNLMPAAFALLSNRELRRLQRNDRKGVSDTFDAAGYLALLRRLREARFDETVYAPDFYRELEEPIAASIAIGADVKLVVTEGNYLLLDQPPWDSVADALDESWYLQVAERQRCDWLIKRHRRFGRSRAEARRWVAAVDEPNAERICGGRSRASAVLTWCGDGGGRFELEASH